MQNEQFCSILCLANQREVALISDATIIVTQSFFLLPGRGVIIKEGCCQQCRREPVHLDRKRKTSHGDLKPSREATEELRESLGLRKSCARHPFSSTLLPCDHSGWPGKLNEIMAHLENV